MFNSKDLENDDLYEIYENESSLNPLGDGENIDMFVDSVLIASCSNKLQPDGSIITLTGGFIMQECTTESEASAYCESINGTILHDDGDCKIIHSCSYSNNDGAWQVPSSLGYGGTKCE